MKSPAIAERMSAKADEENAPLDEYGLSMISVLIDIDGSLDRLTTRWNHEYNGENNPELCTPEQLERVINLPFYKTFKPYTRDELHAMGVILFDEVQELLDNGMDAEEIFDDVYSFYDDGGATGAYSNNAGVFTYTFKANQGVVQADLNRMYLASGDTLFLYDGTTLTDEHLIAKLGGNITAARQYFSSGDKMTFKFYTHGNTDITYYGWDLSVTSKWSEALAQANVYLNVPTADASWRFSTFTKADYEKLFASVKSGETKIANDVANDMGNAEAWSALTAKCANINFELETAQAE